MSASAVTSPQPALPPLHALSPNPRVQVAAGPAAISLLDARWDVLVGRQALPNPTLSATWLREVARWQSGTPLVVIAEEGGDLVGGAALEVRHAARHGPRLVTWLGPVAQQFCPDILVDPEHPGAGELVLAAALGEADALTIGVSASGEAARALHAVAPWHSAAVTGERFIVSCPPPRLEYARKRAAYEVRRAARLGGEVTVRVAADPDDVAPALVRLFRIHRDRWRDRPDETPRFATSRAHRLWNMRTVAAMAAGGNVRIAEVIEDGRAVAGAVGFLHGTGGLAHTQAVRIGGKLRQPGHLAVLACVEALAEAGATAVDLCYGSGEPSGPKARLGAVSEPVELVFAARTPHLQRPYLALRRVRRAVGRPRSRRS